MISIAVTGGIACGKSLFCKRFLESVPEGQAFRFDSDACVASLYSDEDVLRQIDQIEPESEIVSKDGLNMSLLRQRVFENSEFREKLEEILHPLVLRQAGAFSDLHSGRARLLLFEVPLLYEVEFPLSRDLDVVVAASRASQELRIQRDRGLRQELAQQIIDSQMPLEDKISRADIVVWNDGQMQTFEAQISHLAARCSNLFN